MTENEFKYWAFLSYSHQDNCERRPDAPEVSYLCWGDWLRDALKDFPVPADFTGQINARGEIIPQRIDSVFQTGQELTEDAGLSADMVQALTQSRYLIVICSPRSAKNPGVNEAVLHFKQLGRGSRILPIVIAGEPNARESTKPGISPEDECFVPAMRHPLNPDGTIDVARRERGFIFADARHGADKQEILAQDRRKAETGLEIARIQLIAGLIGVGFNELWRREQQRRFAGFAEAQQQIREVQGQLLEMQNLPRDVQSQIQEAQNKLLEAQSQAREALSEVEEARNQARVAQLKVLETQNQAREAQSQLEEARNQARQAQNQFKEIQNLPRDLQDQLEEAQKKVLEAQSDARKAQSQVEEARDLARQSLNQVQELQKKSQGAQSQLEEARNQAREAERKVIEAQQQTRETELKLLAAQNQAQEIQTQTRDVQGQIQAAQTKVREAEEQARSARSEVEEVRRQSREAQAQLQATQDKVRAAQRLTKVFAVLAVLAALAAGVILSQRKSASPELAKTSTEPALQSTSSTNQLDSGQIRLALQQARDLDSLAARIPQENISETFNLAATILADPQRSRLQEQLLDIWVKADAAAAFDWSRQLTNAAARQFALEKIVPAMAADSPTNALAVFDWLQSQTNSGSLYSGDERNTIITGLFKNWAAKDLDAAANASGQLAEGATKDAVAEIILSRRIVQAPASAATVITNLPPGDFRQKAIAELGRRWGGTEATNALAWAEALPEESDRVVAINQIVENWAQVDLSAATNWVAGLSDAKKDAALLTLATPWAQKDAKGLAAYAFTLPAGEVQTHCLTEVCRVLATNDFAGALELLQPFTNNVVLRHQFLEQAARSGDLSTVDATAKTIAAMPPGDDQQAAVKGLVSRWTVADPKSALNWLTAFPETNAQPEQVQSVLKTWAQNEPAAVAGWLTNLPAGATSDAMLSSFLDGAVMKYPAFAAQWTQSVTNEIQRQQFQVQVTKEWLKADPIAAQKWIDTLELPVEIKQTLKVP